MRMRTLIGLILSCLLLSVLVVPAAAAHERRGRHRDSHDRHQDRSGGPRSFLGASASGNCSRETKTCDFTFSRSVSSQLHERLGWLLTEKMDAVEAFGERICSRAEKENECAGSFIAGLWNGLDALEIAVAEASCGTLHLEWSKSDGLSQSWGTTDGDDCTD